MPGRQRIRIRAKVGSLPDALAMRQRINVALAGAEVHSEDTAPVVEQDEEGQRTVTADIRFSRSQGKGAARDAMVQALALLPGATAEVLEHVCFHGLEDEEDYLPCEATLTYRRFESAGEVLRGASNG